MKFFLLFSILILFIAPAYAEIFSVTSDKSEYHNGETITISGQVDFDPETPSIIIQILTPAKDNFAGIANVFPNNDGSFSTTFRAGGPTWPGDGTYTVKVSYGEIFETTFDFTETQTSEESTSNEQTSSENQEIITTEQSTPSIQSTPQPTTQQPKTHIPGFPSLDESPQYYIDRYNNELDYKAWFDSQFTGQSVESVVGYDQTHIPGFPSLDESPQYYIDRYNNELDYKAWFDSQFPGESIHNVLGFPDPINVPNWIKITAEWWSTGKISDSDFLDGIEFMIKNNILVIPFLPEPEVIPNQDVPDWIRNTASWWSQEKISEDEFLNAIKFLIQNGIIVV